MNDQERYFVAVHEAAHAICRLLFKLPMGMGGASVVPEPGTLGRVAAKQTTEPEPRMHLILGWEPHVRQRDHDRIITFIAGDAAEELAKVKAGVFHKGYLPESSDYKNAHEIADILSSSPGEEWALLHWLNLRTKEIVSGFYFRKIQDAIVPKLLEEGDLSEAELIELLRPIAADVLDISPKTWRGRLRLRIIRATRPFRRVLRRAKRRYRWWRSKRNEGS